MIAKLIKIEDKQGTAYVFHCPGCSMDHIIPVSYASPYSHRNGKQKPTWKFNGDIQSPTFHPEFRIEWKGAEPPQRCHVFIREGILIYLVGSTHALSGSRVRMMDA